MKTSGVTTSGKLTLGITMYARMPMRQIRMVSTITVVRFFTAQLVTANCRSGPCRSFSMSWFAFISMRFHHRGTEGTEECMLAWGCSFHHRGTEGTEECMLACVGSFSLCPLCLCGDIPSLSIFKESVHDALHSIDQLRRVEVDEQPQPVPCQLQI